MGSQPLRVKLAGQIDLDGDLCEFASRKEFSQGIKEFDLQRREARGRKYRAQWRNLFLPELLAINFSFLIHSLNFGLTQWFVRSWRRPADSGGATQTSR